MTLVSRVPNRKVVTRLPRSVMRMQEVQEQPRVLAHRAGNIEQRDDRRLLLARAEILQIDHRPARLHTRPQGAAHVDHVATPAGREPARAHEIERERELAIASLAAAISAAVICAKSFFCSTSRSDTVRRASISTSVVLLASFRPENSASWMRCAPGSGGFGADGVSRQHGGEQLVDIAALAEEDAEGLVEQDRVLVPLHEHRVQRPIEVLAVADARHLHGLERIEHGARADRNAGRAQRAREVEDVLGEAALGTARVAVPSFCLTCEAAHSDIKSIPNSVSSKNTSRDKRMPILDAFREPEEIIIVHTTQVLP